ncbi:hypothetical protein DF3PA_20025 [Candidatus Defluviicoccus seviourii]|uniref:Uncharacterized protein n=1 Tax=Candidatus Defluviicoccus seviourii TaxID=2565273 RepID=A0A564WCC7_9PROT|nr:hypothetical protein DF3PA_20025 [Candidatus Defluviicoccus seviourii]
MTFVVKPKCLAEGRQRVVLPLRRCCAAPNRTYRHLHPRSRTSLQRHCTERLLLRMALPGQGACAGPFPPRSASRCQLPAAGTRTHD